MIQPSKARVTLAFVFLFSLAACNFPGLEAMATATPTFTATFTPLPPTATSLPPSATPTIEILITDTPNPLLPTAPGLFPTVPPLVFPTDTRAVTSTPIIPEAGAKFEGTFEGGALVFRVNSNSTMVIPKSLTFRKVLCQEGKRISDLITFEPPPSFPITNGSFNIVWGTQATISGYFRSTKSAWGSLTAKVKGKGDGGICTIGPISWVASAP